MDGARVKRALLMLLVFSGLSGCVKSGDPGPLTIAALSFRTLEDAYHAEWIVEVRNQGNLPIENLVIDVVHSQIVDGSVWSVAGHEYRFSGRYAHDEKFGGSISLEPPSLHNEEPGRLLNTSRLGPGENVTVRIVKYYDHLNYTFLGGGQGHRTFEEGGGRINATDFYTLTVPADYQYKGYNWAASHYLSCFTPDGTRIRIVEGPAFCDDVSAINFDSPRWTRYGESGWFG